MREFPELLMLPLPPKKLVVSFLAFEALARARVCAPSGRGRNPRGELSGVFAGYARRGWLIQRRSQAALSPREQERFLCAYRTLSWQGVLGRFVDIHAEITHHMHTMPASGDPSGQARQRALSSMAPDLPLSF
ncbi:hypothetical protein A7Q09_05480 [Methylacidiphilum sp. Yel]|nr:hypothetical protein A7Q09_05480 [Methylacidiphilum sp. Yel]